jgi:hypothetical protein
MAPRYVRSDCDMGSKANFVGHRMGDQKLIISSSFVFGRHVKPLLPLQSLVPIIRTGPAWWVMTPSPCV